MLLLAWAGCNLLGHDLQVKLQIGIVPEGDHMVVRMMKLTEGEEIGINPKVWADGERATRYSPHRNKTPTYSPKSIN